MQASQFIRKIKAELKTEACVYRIFWDENTRPDIHALKHERLPIIAYGEDRFLRDFKCTSL